MTPVPRGTPRHLRRLRPGRRPVGRMAPALAEDPPMCNGFPANVPGLVGTAGDDVIVGTAGATRFRGWAGTTHLRR